MLSGASLLPSDVIVRHDDNYVNDYHIIIITFELVKDLKVINIIINNITKLSEDCFGAIASDLPICQLSCS